MTSPRWATLAVAAFVALGITGCATTSAPAPAPAPEASVSADSSAITITDPWVKAATKDGMTAIFAAVENTTNEDLVLVSAATTVSPDVQLHQTSADASGNMVMSEVDGGLTVPAHGTLALEPGGNHIMLMGLTATLQAGDAIPVTLTFSDGSVVTLDAPVKDYSGAQENYAGDEHAGHDSAEHDAH